jgi:hypothetical protein
MAHLVKTYLYDRLNVEILSDVEWINGFHPSKLALREDGFNFQMNIPQVVEQRDELEIQIHTTTRNKVNHLYRQW